jgi:hypothetical protein
MAARPIKEDGSAALDYLRLSASPTCVCTPTFFAATASRSSGWFAACGASVFICGSIPLLSCRSALVGAGGNREFGTTDAHRYTQVKVARRSAVVLMIARVFELSGRAIAA